VVPRGDHLVTEFVDADGSISIKFPWWTGPDAYGRLRVTGTSMDGRPGSGKNVRSDAGGSLRLHVVPRRGE
jgi:hypothetical protein